MTWTLVVFILIFGQPSQAVVPGFVSYEACNSAAKAYMEQLTAQDPDKRMVFSSRCFEVRS